MYQVKPKNDVHKLWPMMKFIASTDMDIRLTYNNSGESMKQDVDIYIKSLT